MPASHIAYFHAVESRWYRHSWKLAPVSVGRILRHVASKPARVIEIDGRAALVLTRFHARIEATQPFPWIDVDGAARAAGDRADMDIAVIDVPAFLAVFWRSAAGECGHALLKRAVCQSANRSMDWA